MNNDSTLPRQVLEYGICLPVAILLGYVLSKPLETKSLLFVGMVMGVIFFPLMMQWHHRLLVVCWNASIIVFFLPGDLSIGSVMAGVSLFFALLARCLRRDYKELNVNSVAIPVLALALVVLATAFYTGGIQGRALGSDQWGAKRYLGVLGAMMGYFALVSQPLPKARVKLYTTLFFGSGMLALVSDLIFLAGPSFYILFNLFPANVAFTQAASEGELNRLTGVSFFGLALYATLLVRHGLMGLLSLRHWWRMALFIIAIGCGLLGGYRSVAVIMGLYFVVQFCFEGLWKTKLLWITATAAVGGVLLMLTFLPEMPLSVQRSLSFVQYVFPSVDLDPMATRDASSTLEWRRDMWKVVWNDIPKYFWAGKGFTFSGSDYELMKESVRRGFYTSYEDTLINGNYHNGFLTLIIPFGIWGLLAFVWFCGASLRVLYLNWRHGDPELKTVNTFLLTFFSARLLFYFTLYGQFDLDLFMFTGAVGLSLSINRGLRRQAEVDDLERADAKPATVEQAKPLAEPVAA